MDKQRKIKLWLLKETVKLGEREIWVLIYFFKKTLLLTVDINIVCVEGLNWHFQQVVDVVDIFSKGNLL